MKQTLVKNTCTLAIMTALIVFSAIESFAEMSTDKTVVLKNSVGQLSIAPSGAMQFTTKSADCPVWSVRPGEMWKITIAKGESSFKLSDAISFTPDKQNLPKFTKIENGVEFSYDMIQHGNERVLISPIGNPDMITRSKMNRTAWLVGVGSRLLPL